MRTALKILGWTAASLALLILLLLLAILVAGNTAAGRRLLERSTASLSDGRVRLTQLGGAFPAQLELGRLELSDERGVWLTAEQISLRWSPMALLARHIQVDSLEVRRLEVQRRPIVHPDEDNKPPSVPRTDLAHLAILRLDLGPELAGSAVSLVVTASAHLRSLQDASANILAQRTSGLGNYQLVLKFDPARMDAKLQLREPANGPLENILKIPGLGDLSVQATLSGPRTADNIQLELDAGELHGRLQGSVNLPAKSANLTYTLKASRMTPAPGLSWNRIAMQGRWAGPLTAPQADGHLEVEALQTPGEIELGALTADLKAADGLLSARAVLERLVIPGPKPELLRDSPLTVDATVHMNDAARPVRLTATHTLFRLRVDARTVGKQTARVALSLPDLRPLAALAGQDVKGSSTINADLTHDDDSTTLTADSNSKIEGGKAGWVGLLRGPARLQLSGKMTDRSFSVDKLALTGSAVSLAANATAARTATQDLNARFTLSLPDLRRLSPELAGKLQLTGKLDGPAQQLAATADIKTTLSVRGSALGALTASLNAAGLPHEPRGTIEIHGDLDSSPVSLNVSLEQTKPGASGQTTAARSGTFHGVIHRADWKSAHAEGDFSGSDDLQHTRGQAAFRVGQLGDFNRLLGTTLDGGIDGTLAMRPDAAHSHVDFQVTAQNVAYDNVKANLQVQGAGSLDALHLQVAGHSPAIAGKPADVTSASVLNLSAHTLQLASAEATFYGQQIRLVAPVTVSFADGLALTATTLKAREAELEVEGRFSPSLDLRAALRAVQPDLINAFVPDLLAAGKIDGDAVVKGSFSQPTGQIHLQAVGIRSASDVANGLPAVDVHAAADLMGNTALLDVTLGAGSKSKLTLGGHAPLSASGALDLKLAGTLDAALLNPLLEVRGRHVQGQLVIDTTVTGSTTAPQIGGTMRLSQGTFRDYAQGINLTDIAAQLEGNEKALRITSLTARAAPGTLSATGTANILDAGIPIDIKLTAKNAQPITNNIVTANVDADIHVSGKAREHLNVAGTVHVNRANVGIPSGFPPNVAVLDVRRPGQTPPVQSEKPLIIDLDIRVEAPRQILVQGRGLDAELGGELRIRGTTDSPRVSGGFDLQRGTFDIASSRLTFSNGSVTFNGAGLRNKLDPTLDFTAQTALSDSTAIVRITGFADSPKIELSSTPDMPQDEILARLLFGESAAQLSALQVVQIGAALATLGGGGSSLNPLAKIQKTLGLDRLSVAGGSSSGPTGTTNSGATIEAGRYVSSRVFVAVKESTTGTSQLAVDVDLTKHLKLQTRLGNGAATAQGTTPENDPGSSVGIAYQFEY